MLSAVLSLILGLFAWSGLQFPLVLPVLGLALGANAWLKHRRSPGRPQVKWLGIAGLVLNGALVVAQLV